MFCTDGLLETRELPKGFLSTTIRFRGPVRIELVSEFECGNITLLLPLIQTHSIHAYPEAFILRR